MHILIICLIIFWHCCVAHPSEVCVYECSGCKEWKQYANRIISGPYWLEILHLVISKLTDASHKRKLFSYQNCALLRPRINKKVILVCSTNYSRSDVYVAKNWKNELLLLLLSSLLSLLCYILLNKFGTLPLLFPKAATCIQYRAFLKVLAV